MSMKSNKILISRKVKKGTVKSHYKRLIRHISAWLLFPKKHFGSKSVYYTVIVFKTDKDIKKQKFIYKA